MSKLRVPNAADAFQQGSWCILPAGTYTATEREDGGAILDIPGIGWPVTMSADMIRRAEAEWGR